MKYMAALEGKSAMVLPAVPVPQIRTAALGFARLIDNVAIFGNAHRLKWTA